jgi:hypothetical protein
MLISAVTLEATMKRVFVMILTMLMPITATANAQVARVSSEEPSIADSARRAGGAASSDAGLPAPGAAFQPAPVAPPRDVNSPRRRGSMVGYIDDAVVGSKIRLRFEFGLHNDAPDRAEFFYAKCGCYRDLAKNHPAYDPNAAGPGPGIVTDLNFQQFYVLGEYAVGDRFSVFGELPTRWLQPQSFQAGTGSFVNQSGIGDLRAGVKLALRAAADQVLTAQVKTFLPTGDGLHGLGTDHASVEPALLYYQQLSDLVVLESQVGAWLPFAGSKPVPTTATGNFSGNVFFYGLGPSFEVYRGGSVRFAPVVELVGWHVLSGYQTGGTPDATGTNIVNLKVGARTAFDRGSVYVGYGHALTTARWYEDIVRFEYRYSF